MIDAFQSLKSMSAKNESSKTFKKRMFEWTDRGGTWGRDANLGPGPGIGDMRVVQPVQPTHLHKNLKI